jgi:type II secretory pathway pseudopilin PulG
MACRRSRVQLPSAPFVRFARQTTCGPFLLGKFRQRPRRALEHFAGRSLMRRKGFTLIELLVVNATVALLISSVLMPAKGLARERARQASCQANMSALSRGLGIYSASSCDQFPFPLISNLGAPDSGDAASDYTPSTTGDCISPTVTTNPNWPLARDTSTQYTHSAMQNVWLLIKEGYATTATFHCPSDTGWTNRDSLTGTTVNGVVLLRCSVSI